MLQIILQNEVLKSIRKDKISEAIFLLEEFIDENHFGKSKFSKNLTSIRRRLTDLEKTNSKNIISYEVYIRTKNKIVDDLLFLLDDVESLNSQNEKIISSELESTEIWIVIKGNFEEFNEEKQQDFLKKVRKALKQDNSIKIKQIKSGSIHILLKMPVESAIRFYKMIKTGKMSDLNILDSYFSLSRLNMSELKTSVNASAVSYWDIGFNCGVLGDEEFKNLFISKYRELHEEYIIKERDQLIRIEDNLYNQRKNLDNQLLNKTKNLNQLQKSILILKFILSDYQDFDNKNTNVILLHDDYLKELVEWKATQIDQQNFEIKNLEEEISEINFRIRENAKIINEYLLNLKQKNNRILSIIEEIEKGYAYGHTQKSVNKKKNNSTELP